MVATRNFIHRLGLGTVQFGLDYGISNRSGATPLGQVKQILQKAVVNGVSTLDTASSYGSSEAVIGKSLCNMKDVDKERFNIVTKIPPISTSEITQDDIDMVSKSFAQSLTNLQCANIYGLLLHDADDLKRKNSECLFRYLGQLKSNGIVKKIGVSIYDEEQLTHIMKRFPIDLVQVPANVFDQRLIKSGLLAKLDASGIEVHVRSAFLQGLIFMSASDLPSHLSKLSSPLLKLQELADENCTSVTAIALAFLMKQNAISKVVCGVNSISQFQSLLDDASSLPEIDTEAFRDFAIDDPNLVNPANW